jgi:hypothetical protein
MEFVRFSTYFEHYCSRRLLLVLEKVLKPLLFALWLFVWCNPVSSWLTMPSFRNGYDFLSWYQKLYFLAAQSFLFTCLFCRWRSSVHLSCDAARKELIPRFRFEAFHDMVFSLFPFHAVEMISNCFWTKISVTVTMPKMIFQIIRTKWKNVGDREYGVY